MNVESPNQIIIDCLEILLDDDYLSGFLGIDKLRKKVKKLIKVLKIKKDYVV